MRTTITQYEHFKYNTKNTVSLVKNT